jgi:hypothetical protein
MILDANGQPIKLPRVFSDDYERREAQIIANLTAEILDLEEVGEAMVIAFRPVTAFQHAGLVQLALRHPELQENNREAAIRFLTAVREYFADCPAVLDVLDRGDDPSQDVGFAGKSE